LTGQYHGSHNIRKLDSFNIAEATKNCSVF